MSSAQLALFHQRETRGPERRRIRAVLAAGPGPPPRLRPLRTHSRAASAGQGRVPGEHGPPATLSGRGWRAVLLLLGTTSTPAQPQVTAQLGPGPVGGVCDCPPRGEAGLTSFPHHAGGQPGDLLPLVGQETEARSSSQQTTDAELLWKSQTWPSLGWTGQRGRGWGVVETGAWSRQRGVARSGEARLGRGAWLGAEGRGLDRGRGQARGGKVGQSRRGRGRGARPGEGRRGQIRGARPPPRRQADAASTWKALQWVLDARGSSHHGGALAGHPGLWREGRVLLMGRSASERSAVTAAPPGLIIRKLHQASLGDEGLFSRTLVVTKLFLFSLASPFCFPLLCPEGSGIATGARGSGWGRLHTPCPLPAHFSLRTEGGGEGGSLSRPHCPARLDSDGQVPQLLLVPGRPCLAWTPRPPTV